MEIKVISLVLVIWLTLIFTSPANAYLGPGIGAGAVGVVLGILGSIILSLFAIIYYPIKRALKKMKKSSARTIQNLTDNNTPQ